MDQDLKNDLKAISERVGSLEIAIAHMTEQLRAHIEVDRAILLKLESLIDKHDRIIFGNSEPGVKIRIDRLEEKEKARQWQFRSLWVAIMALLSKIFYDLFFSAK